MVDPLVNKRSELENQFLFNGYIYYKWIVMSNYQMVYGGS